MCLHSDSCCFTFHKNTLKVMFSDIIVVDAAVEIFQVESVFSKCLICIVPNHTGAVIFNRGIYG